MRNRPVWFLILNLMLAARVIDAQDTVRSTPTDEEETAQSEPVVVSATRFDIPLEQSPASVSVINSEDLEQKQIERVSDALREVPGLSVVQTGTAGQLTSVFTRGLRSEHTQVLLDGIPINQGLQGAFNFADFTTDDIGRIEGVRRPQSTLYGPRALLSGLQLFIKRHRQSEHDFRSASHRSLPHRTMVNRSTHRLESDRLVGAQIHFCLRSRAANQRPERGRVCRPNSGPL